LEVKNRTYFNNSHVNNRESWSWKTDGARQLIWIRKSLL